MQFFVEVVEEDDVHADAYNNTINLIFAFLVDEAKTCCVEDRIILGQICPRLWNLRSFKEAVNEFSECRNPQLKKISREELFAITASSVCVKNAPNTNFAAVISHIFDPANIQSGITFNSRETADLM